MSDRIVCFTAGLALGASLTGCATSSDPATSAVPQSRAPAPPAAIELHGHRGARGLAPENTLPGFARALEVGVDTLELDIGTTKDGVVIVYHDERLNPDMARLDGAWIEPPTPAVHALPFSELVRYDVGRLRPDRDYGARFPEQIGRDQVSIPRLANVLAMAEKRTQRRIRYNIETKLNPTTPEETAPPDELARALLSEIQRAGVADRTVVQSFDWRTLNTVARLAPDITRSCLTTEDPKDDTLERGQPGASPWTAGLDVDDVGGSVPKLVAAANCTLWSPRFTDLTPAAVAEAHDLGLRVIAWVINEPEEIDRAIEMSIDGIISDRPDVVRTVFADRGLPLPRTYP